MKGVNLLLLIYIVRAIDGHLHKSKGHSEQESERFRASPSSQVKQWPRKSHGEHHSKGQEDSSESEGRRYRLTSKRNLAVDGNKLARMFGLATQVQRHAEISEDLVFHIRSKTFGLYMTPRDVNAKQCDIVQRPLEPHSSHFMWAFRRRPGSKNDYFIHSVHDDAKVLSVSGSSHKDGARIILSNKYGNESQLFDVVHNGDSTYSLRSASSGMFAIFDARGHHPDNPLLLHKVNDGFAHHFYLERC
jgi:hypothetical protein